MKRTINLGVIGIDHGHIFDMLDEMLKEGCTCEYFWTEGDPLTLKEFNSKYPNIKVISIVKGANRVRATETILSIDGIIEMDKHSKGYLLLQEIRDESHRFAITAQRKKKKQSIKKSFLDEINGIGPVTKNKLLKRYKNIKNIKTAKLDELMTIRGINEKIEKEIIYYEN